MEIAFQRGLTAPQHDIVDPMFFQIAQRGRIAVLSGEEMLVDTQHGRTQGIGSFGSQSFEYVLEPALDGRARESLALSQSSAIDPIPVTEKDHTPEQFAGSLPLQDSGKLLAESAAAGPA